MDQLQPALDDFLAAHERMPGVVVHVESPATGGKWSGAAGVIERGGATLEPGVCFRIASITKTFVAVAVLRLVEDGRIELDGAAAPLLPELVRSRLAAAYPSADLITVRHLLQHTSGVYDFGTDDAHFGARIVADPHKRWSAIDQLDIAFEHGTPYCEPGAEFHYSDTGYVLLGLVLEKATGLPIETAVRRLAGIDSLGLSATWWEGKETAPADAPPRVHQYMGSVDTFDFDGSFDGHGGGGLVSTAADLVHFLQALVGGELLGPALTAEMLDTSAPTDLGDIGQRCGLGIFESTIDGVRRIGHEGYWGVWMYHHPDHGVTSAGLHTALPYDMPAKQRLVNAAVR